MCLSYQRKEHSLPFLISDLFACCIFEGYLINTPQSSNITLAIDQQISNMGQVTISQALILY